MSTSPRASRLLRATGLTVLAVMLAPVRVAGQYPSHLPDLSIEELMGLRIQRVFGASERLQPVTEAPSSVTIVTADEIRRYGYRTLADILHAVRGFYVSNDRNYSYVGVRGFGLPGDYNSRVLLLINGHKVNDSIYDQAYIGAELGIDAAMFDRVEIIRGPASSLYGTSAFFAVVNVITRSGASMRGARLEADAGTLGGGMGRASFGRTFAGGADLAVSGTYERSDGVRHLYFPAFDTPGTNHGVADGLDGEELAAVYGRFSLRDLAVTATFGRRVKDVPTASFSTLFNSQSPRERTTDRRSMIHAHYERKAGLTRVAADLAFDHLRYDGVYPYASESAGAPLLINDDSSIGARWGAAARATRPLPGGHIVTVGSEFIAHITQNQWGTYTDTLVPGYAVEQSSRQSAVYLQDEIRVRRWLLVNAGLRFDDYERFARTTPRGAVIVMPTANQSFKYLYGRAFRAPNAYELYYYQDLSSSLRPESIGTHEIVWEQYVGEWLRTSVSAYRYAAAQLITLDADQAGDLMFFNAGRARAKGLEVEAETRSRRGAQVLASYTRQRAEDGGREPLTNSPGEMARVRVSAPGPFGRSVGAVELQYVAPRHTLAGTTVPGAALAHATVSARLTRSVELVGGVRNLFNQTYADPASGEHVPVTIERNGRTARAGVRWTLGAPRP